jgi:oxygen-independent coproporphyrinogen-3 oxidase
MAGIYIHIPFCRQKCYYCDFYKTVNTSQSKRFLSVLKDEAKVRKNYILNEPVETIYFGGGTPSVLTAPELADLLRFFKNEFKVNSDAEITFEANPDDLNVDYLKGIKDAGVNRLSIGIQSFQNKHLEKMNRRHNSVQAIQAIEDAEKIGFANLSVDLIYGLPGLTESEWIESLNTVFRLPVQHLSAYHLTYHEGTPFYTWLKKGTLKELKEMESVRQFNILLDLASKNNYEQYEISNFAKNEMYSKHNTSYWMGKKYLGLGPSAHSFNGVSRRWNVSNVESYLKAFEKDTDYFEQEILSQKDKFNEHVLTRIRTKWGVSLEFINQSFGAEMKNYLLKQIEKYRQQETIILENGIVTLSKEGLFISDEIMVDLMII